LPHKTSIQTECSGVGLWAASLNDEERETPFGQLPRVPRGLLAAAPLDPRHSRVSWNERVREAGDRPALDELVLLVLKDGNDVVGTPVQDLYRMFEDGPLTCMLRPFDLVDEVQGRSPEPWIRNRIRHALRALREKGEAHSVRHGYWALTRSGRASFTSDRGSR
jgi:hypothetical protein